MEQIFQSLKKKNADFKKEMLPTVCLLPFAF
jgi:hypothetical protein